MSPNEREENQRPADAEKDVTEPAGRTDVPADTGNADVEQRAPESKLGRTRASGVWAGLIVAAIVLIFLLVFILQNLEAVEIHFLMLTGSVPIGVALLLAAVGGILMVAVPGVARMVQLRRYSRKR